MKKVGMSVSKIAIFLCFAITLFSPLVENTIVAADAYWCKYKDEMYEQKYGNENKIAKKISKNPGSYTGMCDIYNDLGAYLGGDQTGDGNYAQESDEIAICHYDEVAETWHQVYQDYDGYRKGFYCKLKRGKYQNILEIRSKIDQAVLDNPGSHTGLCTPDDVPLKNDPPKSMVWCKYDERTGTWQTNNDTPADVVTELVDFPGSHRGGCTYHEWHTNDYWGHCSDSTVAPAPPSDMVKENREGPGVGDGHTMGKRVPKPRIRYKSKSRVNHK